VHHAPDHHVSERFKSVAADLAELEYEPDLQEEGLIQGLLNRIR